MGLTVEVPRVPGEAVAIAGAVEAELWPVAVLGTLAEDVAVAKPMNLQKDEKVLTASIPAFDKRQVAARLII